MNLVALEAAIFAIQIKLQGIEDNYCLRKQNMERRLQCMWSFGLGIHIYNRSRIRTVLMALWQYVYI